MGIMSFLGLAYKADRKNVDTKQEELQRMCMELDQIDDQYGNNTIQL